ncbi:hypothetical protein WOLCODRAFT_165480 [Wolfiporia cocos MD-104 SS10]|uniref:Cell morphogenesis protein n=1 Tax=Wolfiporia cocos (strain MD-104) TaxID=742152 RepID=A0A2H3JSI0_WOLCO|nr:hypothetical protein WOLCODRAFT_165480 [Wolfiporia cocos MD-104 SS10]
MPIKDIGTRECFMTSGASPCGCAKVDGGNVFSKAGIEQGFAQLARARVSSPFTGATGPIVPFIAPKVIFSEVPRDAGRCKIIQCHRAAASPPTRCPRERGLCVSRVVVVLDTSVTSHFLRLCDFASPVYLTGHCTETETETEVLARETRLGSGGIMSGEGIQITIPDFDDEEINSTPVFGRSQGGPFWGTPTSGQDSPTILTPLALPERTDKSYFHNRGDSITSDDSAHSLQYTSRKVKSPFAHSAQSSFATGTTGNTSFSKKTSFPSLRNPFKKSSEPAPPLPPLDHQAYPALKNPFNRSTSSLAHHPPMPHKQQPSMHASPPNFRPMTPVSSDARARATPSRARERTYARSQHSHSGSIFHSSDTGSDYGHHFTSSSPPPVPRMPGAFGELMNQDESRSLSDLEDRINMDPRTPSDYALHAIFIRFAASAESHIDRFLHQPLERDPLLTDVMGPGVDGKLDELLQSLGKIAQKHAKQVVDSVMRWRKSQNEPVGAELLRHHTMQASTSARGARPQDVLNERKSLASIYIMCRALIAATQSVAKDGLSEAVGHSLEELTFDQFRRPDVKSLTQSANHRANAELYATLLGQIANVRFESVTDRFLTELGPVASGQVPKDADFKYENLVKGLKHVEIKVWPPESFEEGAEFMASLSKSFENAHGNRLKTIFAETLVHMLHPIAKTAQAEVNHPEWAKAIEVIFPRARDMMAKPRYWHVAYPLAVTSLCVAPQEYFLKHWSTCFEAGLSKMKEKVYRVPVLNGMLRLLWTYLYRCHEPGSAAITKLEAILKHFFPTNRLTVNPQEERIEPITYMVHYILSRHFDFGSEFCLELLQEHSIAGQNTGPLGVLAPERMAIATSAILLSLHVLERDEPTPTWPSSTDFSVLPLPSDYPSSSDPIPSSLSLKSGWTDLLERSNACLKTVAVLCYQTVGKWSVLDDQWSATRLSPTFEDAHNYTIRRHPEGSVAYPSQFMPQISVLQMVFQTWPRCLDSSLAPADAFDMLIRGVVHVEPAVGGAAVLALQRFMADHTHASALLSRMSTFLFDSTLISNEGSGLRLNVESTRLLNLWLSFVDQWVSYIMQKPCETLDTNEVQDILARSEEIEAGSLFLLCHNRRTVYTVGVKAIRLLGVLESHLELEPTSSDHSGSDTPFRFVLALHGKAASNAYLNGHSDVLEPDEAVRLEELKHLGRSDLALQLADSDTFTDRNLWTHIYPAFLQGCMDSAPRVLFAFRDKVVAAASRFHHYMMQLSGIQNRTMPNMPQRSGSSGDKDISRLINDNKHVIHQWHIWVKIACATTQVSDVRPTVNYPMRDHSRARSEANFERDQMTTTRDLFKYLSQFLDSDHSFFRDVAVSSISSFPAHGYSQLLEDLTILASRQFYDDSRPKATNAPVVGRARRQERFHTAVARIYYLTAHLLQDQRSSGKQAALAHVLKYIRNMQAFLISPEHRDLFSLQRLRRYFCGTVERLFDGLATLNDSDRFIPANMHLALYRLCEEWCQLGKQSESVTKRLVLMQTAAGKSLTDPADQAEIIQRFQTETRALSNAAVGAMAALCHKAFFPPDQSSASPTDKSTLDMNTKPLQAGPTLDRLTAILASFHEAVQYAGKKALRSLLMHSPADRGFLDEVLRRAFVTTRDLDTSNARYFEVIAEAICEVPPAHGFSFSQVVCLGLSNLYHPILEIRRLAFSILEAIHEQLSGLISLMQHEASVCSSAPSVYLHAHRLISDVLAGEHPDQSSHVLAQFASWLPVVFDSHPDHSPLLLLQSLEYWVPNIDLMDATKSGLSRQGRQAVYHLMTLTVRYAESHAEQVLVLWTRLVDAPYQINGYGAVRYLLELAPKIATSAFVNCASRVVACLSQSAIGSKVFEELCNLLEPTRDLPTLDHKMTHPGAEEIEEWSDLDVLFADQPKMTLGQLQYVLLFLSEASMDRFWEFEKQLPSLIHALFLHLSHRQSIVRQRARHMLFQLLRSCMSGYDEIADRSVYHSRSDLKAAVLYLEREVEGRLWRDDESVSQSGPKIRWLTSEVLNLLEPLQPKLRSLWGTKALEWGTACNKRDLALRSFQIYRALTPPVTKRDLNILLGRLSDTIAHEDSGTQSFNVGIIMTLTAMTSSGDLDVALLPKLFWSAVAGLSTTAEKEFGHVLEFLDALLTRVDLDDPRTADILLEQQPVTWSSKRSLQSCLLTGLRSSSTSTLTFKLLQRLTKISDARLIDDTEARLRDLYTLSLPWCLHAMASGIQDESLQEFALNVGWLADEEERPSISRIMTSFAKSRFRTKEDFLREAVASLREHYGSEHWTHVITLLMGLVLNKERWLCIHTMQILKVLFQQRETRSPVDLLGSELLMPLLRLLETDLASQALDVLDEPLQISGGPAAKHVLRMSLYHHLRADAKEVESVAEVFGIAQESGWCVPRSSALRDLCRANLLAVLDSSLSYGRPSRIDFQPEDVPVLPDDPLDDDLGDMVQNLHELSSYFQQERSAAPMHHRQLEARVAAILAKSSEVAHDAPQTPFMDVFDVGNMSSYDDDSDDSDYDTTSDLFEFDSLPFTIHF